MAKVLFSTNSDPLRKRVLDLFEREGIEVISTRTYEETITAYRRQKPEIAVLDVIMPDRSGLDIAKELVTENSDTRVLILSDIDTHQIRNYALRSGARDMLVKPFSNEEFVFMVKKYMEDLHAAASA